MAVFINRIYESTSTDILKRIRRIIKSSFPERRFYKKCLCNKDDYCKEGWRIIAEEEGELNINGIQVYIKPA
jgi:hypothetical protein